MKRYIITVGKNQRPGSFADPEKAYAKAREIASETNLPVLVYERGWLSANHFGRELRLGLNRS